MTACSYIEVKDLKLIERFVSYTRKQIIFRGQFNFLIHVFSQNFHQITWRSIWNQIWSNIFKDYKQNPARDYKIVVAESKDKTKNWLEPTHVE